MTSVLMVCTGNICRSPLAAVLLAARLDSAAVSTTSAGTHAAVGRPMKRQAARRALDLGSHPAAVARHSARQLDASMLEGADLILTMTRAQRRAVVQLAPKRLSSTFTLREFARLSAAVDTDLVDPAAADPLRSVLGRMVAIRGTVREPIDPAQDDIVDPFRRGDDAYSLAAQQIAPAVDAVARILHAALAR